MKTVSIFLSYPSFFPCYSRPFYSRIIYQKKKKSYCLDLAILKLSRFIRSCHNFSSIFIFFMPTLLNFLELANIHPFLLLIFPQKENQQSLGRYFFQRVFAFLRLPRFGNNILKLSRFIRSYHNFFSILIFFVPIPLNFLELASIHPLFLLLFLQKESQQPDRDDVFFREYSHFFGCLDLAITS